MVSQALSFSFRYLRVSRFSLSSLSRLGFFVGQTESKIFCLVFKWRVQEQLKISFGNKIQLLGFTLNVHQLRSVIQAIIQAHVYRMSRICTRLLRYANVSSWWIVDIKIQNGFTRLLTPSQFHPDEWIISTTTFVIFLFVRLICCQRTSTLFYSSRSFCLDQTENLPALTFASTDRCIILTTMFGDNITHCRGHWLVIMNDDGSMSARSFHFYLPPDLSLPCEANETTSMFVPFPLLGQLLASPESPDDLELLTISRMTVIRSLVCSLKWSQECQNSENFSKPRGEE